MIAVFGVVLAWPMWMAIIVTFVICTALGGLNRWIVIRTGLPSFIVTLAFHFILRGLTIDIPQTLGSKTNIGGIRDAAEGNRFSSGPAMRELLKHLRAAHGKGNLLLTGCRC